MGTVTYPYQTNGTDVASKIDELSTQLCAGRLSAENKEVLVNAHNFFNNTSGIEEADRVVLKLLTTTPEYHTSNTGKNAYRFSIREPLNIFTAHHNITVRKNGSERTVTPPPQKSSLPYKAIVYINFAGGVDSYNILAPRK